MLVYTVTKNNHYIDRLGYTCFQPEPMPKSDAEHAAYETGGVVQEWDGDTLVREYRIPVSLPRLELTA